MNNAALKLSDETTYQETSAGFSKVLSGFSRSEPLDITGADIIGPRALLERNGVEKKYPLWGVLLNNVPLSASMYYEGEHWFAELEWLNVSSHGESPSAAIYNLELHIDHFTDFYSSQDDDELTEYALGIKRRFAQIQRIG